ncbi:hypothetical protein [Methylorubrum aminovorans]
MIYRKVNGAGLMRRATAGGIGFQRLAAGVHQGDDSTGQQLRQRKRAHNGE